MCDITKTCAVCETKMEINLKNINGVAKLKEKYYHTHCLKELAAYKVTRKNHASYWQDILDDASLFEKDAKNTLTTRVSRDKLNVHLLNNYNICRITESFWRKIELLSQGTVNNKACKPVSTDVFADAWIWSQRNLDIINKNNKINKRGPKNDNDRLNYDFSIVLSHIPDYLNYLKKQELEEAERERQAKERIKIDYKNIASSTEIKTSKFDDISDFLDDMF